MNNKLLILNMKYVDRISLLDDDCDIPLSVSDSEEAGESGEIPLVIYDALDGWGIEDGYKKEEMSEKFWTCMNELADRYHWDEDKALEIVRKIHIFFQNREEVFFWNDDVGQNITDIVRNIYENGEYYTPDERMRFVSLNGEEEYVNMNNIAMIELPLVLTENRICMEIEEMLDELGEYEMEI